MSQKSVTDALDTKVNITDYDRKVYFYASSNIKENITFIDGFNITFLKNSIVNYGEFSVSGGDETNFTYVGIPEDGLYLISFSGAGYNGQDRLIRFWLRIYSDTNANVTSHAGMTLRPRSSSPSGDNGYDEVQNFSTIRELRQGYKVYVYCSQYGTFSLDMREISICKLK